MTKKLWASCDTKEVKQQLRGLTQDMLEVRAAMLDEQLAHYERLVKSYPHVVQFDPKYLDEYLGSGTTTRLELIQQWLKQTFPKNSYLPFGHGGAIGPYAHYANAVLFKDPEHAMRFKLSW